VARRDAGEAGGVRQHAGVPRALVAILLFGGISGLPNQLIDALLGTWLTKSGWSTQDVVRAGYVTLPYALKFLWAPLVDRYVPPLFGRRRGWLVLAQTAVAIACLGMAATGPEAGRWLLVCAACAALASASIDLVVNGYACEAVPSDRLPAAAGLQVWGWRAASLCAATVVPLAVPVWGWSAAYAAGALALGLGLIAVLLAPEPTHVQAPTSLRQAVMVPLLGFHGRFGLGGFGLLLAFVVSYRLADGVAGLFITPFLANRYPVEVLSWRGVSGLVGAGIGVALAGWLATRWRPATGLWVFGLAQALSNLAYLALGQGWLSGTGGLIIAVVIDNACAAAAAAAFVGFLMRLCTSSCAATQYALLTAVAVLVPHALRELGGMSATVGWTWTWIITVLLGLPGLLLIPLVMKPARLEQP
jgi:PAT family beta-lactamase induction signal transducer AmpG